MGTSLKPMSLETLERHHFEALSHFSKMEEVEFIEGSGFYLLKSDINHPLLNAVLLTRMKGFWLSRQVSKVIESFQKDQKDFCWYVWPSSEPEDLRKRLEEAGLKKLYSSKIVGVEMQSLLPLSYPLDDGFRLECVRKEQQVSDFCNTLTEVFSFPMDFNEFLKSFFLKYGIVENSPFQNFLIYYDEEPVSTGSLVCTKNYAGMFNAGTKKKYRRRGLLTALLNERLNLARRLGKKKVTATCSDLSFSLYSKFGFKVQASLENWRIPWFFPEKVGMQGVKLK